MSLTNTLEERIDEIVELQKQYFKSGETLCPKWRKKQLKYMPYKLFGLTKKLL